MATVEIVPAHPRHIARIARDMREIDRLECAVSGHSPKAALRAGYRNSVWALTAMVEGKPHAMFGVVALNVVEGSAVPWFLGTDEVYRHGRAMLTRGRQVIALMENTFDSLENHVAAANDKAIRLLRAWGFEIGPEDERGMCRFLKGVR